jgi:hypothetical protein
MRLFKVVFGVGILMGFAACTITKRQFSPGYHIEWKSNHSSNNEVATKTIVVTSKHEPEMNAQDPFENAGIQDSLVEIIHTTNGEATAVSKSNNYKFLLSHFQNVGISTTVNQVLNSGKVLAGVSQKKKNESLLSEKEATYNGLLLPEEYLLRALYLAIIGVVFLGIGLLIILVLDTGDVAGYFGLICVMLGAIGIALCVGNLFLALLSVIFG